MDFFFDPTSTREKKNINFGNDLAFSDKAQYLPLKGSDKPSIVLCYVQEGPNTYKYSNLKLICRGVALVNIAVII